MFRAALPMALCACAIAAAQESVIFSENFDDAALEKRHWYDGSHFRIAGAARAGAGCIEYAWPSRDSKAIGLVRRPPPLRTDERNLHPLLPQALQGMGMDRAGITTRI